MSPPGGSRGGAYGPSAFRKRREENEPKVGSLSQLADALDVSVQQVSRDETSEYRGIPSRPDSGPPRARGYDAP
jgi:uncharacterized damage-inducible protein DinB